MTAIVLVSGGMDSAAVVGVAAKEHKDLAFLHITYGPKEHPYSQISLLYCCS